MNDIYIITPSYNSANTISATLWSVLNQTTTYNVHYHIQDGGSNDGTQDILRQITKQVAGVSRYAHISITWCSEQDNGMYHALERAISTLCIPPQAFMTWINSDDLLAEDCLARIQQIEATFPDLLWVCGQPCNQDMQGNILPLPTLYWHGQAAIQDGLCDGEHLPCLQQEGMFWKKSLFDAAGGLNTSLRLAGDWDLWRRMAEHTTPAKLPWVTGIFRKRPGQLSEDSTKYHAEIASIFSQRKRRQALHRFLRARDSQTATALQKKPDGTLARLEMRPQCTFKHACKLWLSAYGLYRSISVFQKLLIMAQRLVRT